MKPIHVSTTIHQPVEKVFEFVYDPQKRHLWQPEAVETESLKDETGGESTRSHKKVHGPAGLQLQVVEETREFVPNQRHILDTRDDHGRFSAQSQWDFDAVPDGTRVRVQHDVALHGWLRLAGPVFMPVARRKVEGDLRRLKKLLEG